MSNPLVDMDKPDTIFAIGTNMTECHPVAATGLKKALTKGAKLVVADPRKTRLAELAHLHLPIRVGSDVALLLAMAHVIVREGLEDTEFISDRTTEIEAFKEHVREFTPEWASEICEVPAADIEQAALWYGLAKLGAIYYTLGITEHICGVDNVQSLCNLALLTGNLGKAGTTFKAPVTAEPSPQTIPASNPWSRRSFTKSSKKRINNPTSTSAMP